MNIEKNQKKKGFGSRWGFILASVGSAVGICYWTPFLNWNPRALSFRKDLAPTQKVSAKSNKVYLGVARIP
ncbi:MAG TPA: hypothetical protein GX707_16480 [Epulopiscium sp.]|nr:hypothetical protein [Candidatus Epulonipiscium sp.]